MIEFEHYQEPVKKVERNFKNIVAVPFMYGLLGLIGFFIVLAAAKFLGYLIGTVEVFSIDLEDFYLCLVGFFLSFLIKFIESFQKT